MHMREKYEQPQIHIISLLAEDIVTASDGLFENDEWNDDYVEDYGKF